MAWSRVDDSRDSSGRKSSTSSESEQSIYDPEEHRRIQLERLRQDEDDDYDPMMVASWNIWGNNKKGNAMARKKYVNIMLLELSSIDLLLVQEPNW